MDSSDLKLIKSPWVTTLCLLVLSPQHISLLQSQSPSPVSPATHRSMQIINELTTLGEQREKIKTLRDSLKKKKNSILFLLHIKGMLKASNGDFSQEIIRYLSSYISLMELVFLSQYFNWHLRISSLHVISNCSWNTLCGVPLSF